MKNDDINDIAKKIYRSHKIAIDFIIENIPDIRSRYSEIFKEELKKKGMIIGSSSLSYARFLTPDLDKKIPRNGSGWTGKEAFLFEYRFYKNNITFQVVVSPGEQSTIDELDKALLSLPNVKTPGGDKWKIYFREKINYDFNDEDISNENIIEIFNKIYDKSENIIKDVEMALIKIDIF